MNHRPNRSKRLAGIAGAVSLVSVTAFAITAGSQTPPAAKTPPAAQTPAPISTPPGNQAKPAPQPPPPEAPVPSSQQDPKLKVLIDSVPLAPQGAAPLQTPAPKVQQHAAAAWPVDPITGMTLVNGTPVVGRVFIQRKVDGLEKYEYSAVNRDEPPAPQPPIISTRQHQLPPNHVRRMRGIMAQATLWSIDKKRSSPALHMYRPVTVPKPAPAPAR